MRSNREKPLDQLKTTPQFWPSFGFSMVLFALGVGTAWAGLDAILRHHYEMNWESNGAFDTSSGVLTMEGTAAIRFGTGFMSFGIMMIAWSIGMILWFAQKFSPDFVTKILSALKWFSFSCLLTTMTCIFPLWKISSIWFWAVVALVLVFVFVLPNDIRKTWGGRFFIGLICATIACSSLYVRAGAGMTIGIFAAFAMLVHMLMVFPRLQQKLFSENNAT